MLFGSITVVWAIHELIDHTLIRYQHFSHMHPALYSLLAVLLGERLKRMRPAVASAVVAALILALISLFIWTLDLGRSRTLVLGATCTAFPVAGPPSGCIPGRVSAMADWVVGVLALGVLGWSVVKMLNRGRRRALNVASLLGLLGIVLRGLFLRGDSGSHYTVPPINRRETYLTVADGVAAVAQFTGETLPYFYYGDYIGNAINGAYFWGYTRLGGGLPAVDCPAVARLPVKHVVIGGPEPGDIERGADSLASCGLALQPAGGQRIEHGAIAYHLGFYVAAPKP